MVIAGAGIIGIACAHYLNEACFEVVIFDQGKAGGALRKLRKLKPESIEIEAANTMGSYPGIQEGQRVGHSRFGNGRVKKLEGIGANKKAEIAFDNGTIKTLILRFAQLELLDE